MSWRFIGSHPDELEGGMPIEPGQFIGTLDTSASRNKQLIDDGLLIEVPSSDPAPDPKKKGN
jgi:hypothetical protein